MVTLADALPVIRSDQQLISIIVQNLMDNALKYSLDQSLVSVTVKAQFSQGQPGVSIAVTSQVGPAGRPDPARVFQKYYRSTKAQRISGSGLGLPLSFGLAQLLGGWLRLEAPESEAVDAPVCFVLWLPVN